MQNKIRWGVLGTAAIAKNHTLPGMKEAYNCMLYAIAGRNSEKTKAFKEEFGFEKAYQSYDELLDDDNVEAVYIPLPNQLHKEWVIKAARKKKHILCEKPLAPTAEEVKEVVDICRQEGVILMEAFAYLHSNATRQVIREVHDGAVGTPVFVETVFMVRPWEKENIRMRRETMGGCTYDQGCYNISMMLSLLDEVPDEIQAIAHFMENGVDDFSSAYFHFPSGARASCISGMCSGQRADRYLIHGTEGTLEAPLPYNAKGKLSYYIHKDGTTIRKDVEAPSNYRLEAEQFGRCILEGERPLVSNEFSIKNAEVLTEVLKKIGYYS
ncbi:Gfo/Idh/MocA family oxidoreductase [Clostridium sp. AM58-1XD]|uniref:Gfo/Idh/MocA family protein n=1 Tax=Clostridium sp. AM58-1XD TaxID=2292307 RepID=UPI000E50603D|nr:Gfo/Idh/MocA family oxidoreductase [Clostridium sp. AM58-1XD]RGY97734.1 gfo/Idh/MocA family oxidoreductase [Clostridium sp. AM58-1XD]